MDDAELVRQFEDRTLPFEQWTHRAHVRVAYTYLHRHPFEEALARMRPGIKAYNAAHSVPETQSRGYNETMTVAFMRLIEAAMKAYGKVVPTGDGTSFCDAHPHLLHKEVLRLFYSPERRADPRAKTEFVEPDLAPLPDPTKAG